MSAAPKDGTLWTQYSIKEIFCKFHFSPSHSQTLDFYIIFFFNYISDKYLAIGTHGLLTNNYVWGNVNIFWTFMWIRLMFWHQDWALYIFLQLRLIRFPQTCFCKLIVRKYTIAADTIRPLKQLVSFFTFRGVTHIWLMTSYRNKMLWPGDVWVIL